MVPCFGDHGFVYSFLVVTLFLELSPLENSVPRSMSQLIRLPMLGRLLNQLVSVTMLGQFVVSRSCSHTVLEL